ncbi:L-threonylcarbamoyladenylate synthase [Flavobacterium sp. CS20]|jgi:tRNA threonylcarbamoyl adenosine modification protein (Sua5/YciO/YrdC/YwlC family)|uniref:L-threonylcarbamoyladenylate synthase n=1 Tax=Flavobacterium sp. CS20 TaxID=2775246 RepID=UPI001B3A0981|nr:L-threonylcarbamoyladenylate synthase [Flavobacterium sp. CS20]QTY27969.1 threonylcarbamoyl-AMP synthase [Flavobacterium sp. CS20]
MAKLIKIYEENPSEKHLREIVEVLKNDGLIIYPTDTVYGLGCSIKSKKALQKIAQIKNIKLEKANLSFVCESLSNLSEYVAQIDSNTFKILKRNLPGPYTFILPGNNNLPKFFKNKKTVGIRIPDNRITLSIVETLGNPIISTSIKDDDEVIEYTTDPSLILEKWDKLVDIVVDGGYGDNIASTVIDLTTDEPILIREGKGSIEI